MDRLLACALEMGLGRVLWPYYMPMESGEVRLRQRQDLRVDLTSVAAMTNHDKRLYGLDFELHFTQFTLVPE